MTEDGKYKTHNEMNAYVKAARIIPTSVAIVNHKLIT